MNLVAFTSDEVSGLPGIDEMKTRGWYVQPQLAWGASKENIHLSINPASARWVDALLEDLRACVETARTMGGGELAAKLRGALAHLDPDAMSDEQVRGLLAMAGVAAANAGLPARMAEINEVMNALPPKTGRGLTEYLNQLMRQA